MAVQFNLLPDVKLEYNQAQHAKRVVYTLSALASIVAISLVVVSFLVVNVLQKHLLDNANGDITTYSDKLKSIPNLDKILTVQNQLNALPALQNQKHYASRLFNYLPEVTPTNVNIGKLDLDTGASTLEVSGTADTVENINKFVDTLKFTVYRLADVKDSATCAKDQGKWDTSSSVCTKSAFSAVLLSKIDRDDKTASYTIDCSYDTALFTGAKSVDLVVPQETTTRSVLNAPSTSSPLFNGQTQTKTQQQQQGAAQ